MRKDADILKVTVATVLY